MVCAPEVIIEDVRRALAEDIGGGDRSAALIPADTAAHAQVVSRDSAILCGRAWFDETFRQIDRRVAISWQIKDAEAIEPGQVICTILGPARSLLTGERTALNFLQLLSGVATRTHAYVESVRGTGCVILDTRKTIPGLRQAQKYAVTCGGGQNHRMGLYDAILIKENHIAAAGSISAAVAAARIDTPPDIPIEVEVENIEQLHEAIDAGATRLLLDNFATPLLAEAVAVARGRAMLEASGGITLENVRDIANTGVTYISVGDLTKNVRAVDYSLRFMEVSG